ncbi:MAG: efflux transporter outer membrane subunit [Bacteroidota bacterium]
MNRRLANALLAASCVALGGCASYAGIAPIGRFFDIRQLAPNSEVVTEASWPASDWWRAMHDPALDDLIERALQGSPGLQAAAARLDQARAIAGLAESSLGPQLNLSLSSTRERFSEHGLIPPPYAGTRQNINDLQLGGQWEIDFFGKNRAGLQAAVGELRASEAEHQASRLLLASNVARSYYQLARLLAQRQLAEERQAQRTELATLVERRFKAGLDTGVELEAAKGVLPENARDIAALDEQIALARHALAALTAQGPAAVDGIAPQLPASAPLALPEALPADLLGHRPDVVAARWHVESAVHGLAAARAMFYPNINLRAFTGFSAIGFGNWLEAGSRQPGIGLAVSLPIFDAGRLRSQYRVSAAHVDSSVATYNTTLLEALHDVADQLSTLRALEIQQSRQQAAVDSAERAYDLALQRYRADISDRLNVLNVEGNRLAQRRIAIDLQARWIDTRIRLIHALGGGFQPADPSAPPPAAAQLLGSPS